MFPLVEDCDRLPRKLLNGGLVRIFRVCGVLFCGVLLLRAPVVTANEPALGLEHEDAFRQMEMLAEVLLQVRRNYVEERTYEQLLQGAIRGMLHELDPHSAFLDKEAYDNLLEETSGAYGGIGIQIGIRENTLTVIAPIEDTPAFRAGVQSGDRIIAINGESTSGITLREAVRLLRGAKGTSVRLTLIGRGATAEQELEIIRDRIEVASVKGESVTEHGIGYVRVTQFDARSAEKLAKALDDLHAKGMRALILDLRGNPGGLLQQAIRISGLFLPADATVVSTRGRTEPERDVVFTSQGGRWGEIPLVVLVNGGSASASEIIAGAIQDHNRGILIGEQTYGKASVQTIIRLATGAEDSAMRLTTAHYLTPDQRQIHDKGITPDIEVAVSREEWRRVQVRRMHLEAPGAYPADVVAEHADVVDRQLQRAQDLLEALLIFKRQS
jgi:carboxyl-terminal processing protease